MSTLSDFRPENLDEIEIHIDQHLKEIVESLQCCNATTYQRQHAFKCLPAHRNLILNLPAKIQTMKSNAKEKPKSNRSKKKKIFSTPEEQYVPQLNDEEFVDQLNNELLEKLNEFGHSEGLNVVEEMTSSSIIDPVINIGDEIAGQCKIKCPYCSNHYLCRYDRIWSTSNLIKHFRWHQSNQIENDEIETDDKN